MLDNFEEFPEHHQNSRSKLIFFKWHHGCGILEYHQNDCIHDFKLFPEFLNDAQFLEPCNNPAMSTKVFNPVVDAGRKNLDRTFFSSTTAES